MSNPIPNKTPSERESKTLSDEWRCDYYYAPGQSDPEGFADEENRCRRLATRYDRATNRHWCDLEWHDA